MSNDGRTLFLDAEDLTLGRLSESQRKIFEICNIPIPVPMFNIVYTKTGELLKDDKVYMFNNSMMPYRFTEAKYTIVFPYPEEIGIE